MNTGKSNKQISLDIELINNKINIINNEQANSNTFENHNNKDSNLNINLTTERNTIAACRNEVRYQYNVKQFMNTKISNFKEKSLDKDINKEYKFNPITNKVKGRNKIIGKKMILIMPTVLLIENQYATKTVGIKAITYIIII